MKIIPTRGPGLLSVVSPNRIAMTDSAAQLYKPSSIEEIFEKVMYFIFLQLNSLKM